MGQEERRGIGFQPVLAVRSQAGSLCHIGLMEAEDRLMVCLLAVC